MQNQKKRVSNLEQNDLMERRAETSGAGQAPWRLMTDGANNVTTTLENCWTWGNGYVKNGADSGPQANGNGFKMGGGDDSKSHRLMHRFILNLSKQGQGSVELGAFAAQCPPGNGSPGICFSCGGELQRAKANPGE